MDISYKIVRSRKRKKLTITVERDRAVVVHAPESTSEEKIQQIIASKKAWIFAKMRHPQKYDERPHPPGKELVSGESMLYMGRQYRIQLDDSAAEVRFIYNRFFVPRKEAGERYSAFQDWYRHKAGQKILPRVEVFARKLGVEYNTAKITDSRYRWGSCTTNDNVNLNWRLIKAPGYVIDYVVVHELAHLIEPNHTSHFWNIIKSQLAHVEQAKQWLKEHGGLLEQTL
jgi:predicted metal-dependent hydrolase